MLVPEVMNEHRDTGAREVAQGTGVDAVLGEVSELEVETGKLLVWVDEITERTPL